jgi:hypothetical protein
MTKRRISRRRSQKGGGLFDWFSSGSSDNSLTPKKSWSEWFSGTSNSVLGTASGALNNVTNSVTNSASEFGSNISDALNTDMPLTTQPTDVQPTDVQPTDVQPTNAQPTDVYNSVGGRKGKRKGRTMKGGKDGLGLTYYATPVSGLIVAEPTYWINSKTNQYIKGGSKRKRKSSRKSHKSRRNKKH